MDCSSYNAAAAIALYLFIAPDRFIFAASDIFLTLLAVCLNIGIAAIESWDVSNPKRDEDWAWPQPNDRRECRAGR